MNRKGEDAKENYKFTGKNCALKNIDKSLDKWIN